MNHFDINVPNFIDPMLSFPFPLIEEIIEEEQQINQEQIYWMHLAKKLPASQQVRFAFFIQCICKQTLEQLSHFSRMGITSEIIKKEGQRSLSLLQTSAQQFFDKCKSYEKAKQEVNRELSDFDKEIKETTLSFSSCPEFSAEESLTNVQQHFQPYFWENKKVGNVSFKFYSHFDEAIQKASKEESKTNSVRDCLVSVNVDVAVSGLLSVLPYANLTSNAIKIVNSCAPQLEEGLDRLEKNKELTSILHLSSYSDTAEGGFTLFESIHATRFFIKLCQFSHSCLKSATDGVKGEIRKIGDELGIRDEKISALIKRFLNFMKEQPLEETYPILS